jgi:hypothetical protein
MQRSMQSLGDWGRAAFFVVNQLTADTTPRFLSLGTVKILPCPCVQGLISSTLPSLHHQLAHRIVNDSASDNRLRAAASLLLALGGIGGQGEYYVSSSYLIAPAKSERCQRPRLN